MSLASDLCGAFLSAYGLSKFGLIWLSVAFVPLGAPLAQHLMSSRHSPQDITINISEQSTGYAVTKEMQ